MVTNIILTNHFDGRTVNARASYTGGPEFEFQRPANSYTVLQTVCQHRFNIYPGLILWREDGHRKLVTRFG